MQVGCHGGGGLRVQRIVLALRIAAEMAERCEAKSRL
jgi:hypothetical protein